MEKIFHNTIRIGHHYNFLKMSKELTANIRKTCNLVEKAKKKKVRLHNLKGDATRHCTIGNNINKILQ